MHKHARKKLQFPNGATWSQSGYTTPLIRSLFIATCCYRSLCCLLTVKQRQFSHSRCSGSCETLALSWNTNCCCHELLFKELQRQNFQEIGHFLPFLTLCLLWWQGDETWQASPWYLPYCCKQIQQPTPVQCQCEYLLYMPTNWTTSIKCMCTSEYNAIKIFPINKSCL